MDTQQLQARNQPRRLSGGMQARVCAGLQMLLFCEIIHIFSGTLALYESSLYLLSLSASDKALRCRLREAVANT